MQNVNFDDAIAHFEKILDPKNQDTERGFDFTRDFLVINELGKALFFRAQQEEGVDERAARRFLRRAVEHFEKTLELDAENVDAHEFLNKCLKRLGGGEINVPDLPANPTAVEQRLLSLAALFATQSEEPPVRASAARDLCLLLNDQTKERPRLAVLAFARDQVYKEVLVTADNWLKLAAAPALNCLDRQILEGLPDLASAFADARLPTAKRLEAAELLSRGLIQITQRAAPADVRQALVPLAAWPQQPLPVNSALASLADRGFLAGPLPPVRLLVLQALRQTIHPLTGTAPPPEIQMAAARVLARIHLIFHGIFKPDENAADIAVRLHRSRFPAADHASHAIIIYDLNRSERTPHRRLAPDRQGGLSAP
jgi:hypothetical protein